MENVSVHERGETELTGLVCCHKSAVRSGHERTFSESVSTSRLCWSNVHFEQCVYGHNQCEAAIWVPL